MYPSTFFSLFPAFPQDDTVFVAMAFATEFDHRWEHVISPAIRGVEWHGKRLEPIRVDTRKISDSILTEILSGIGRSRLVVADVTQIGTLDGRAIRNGNVMYEVGLAQAIRLPEEVLLFRSDDAPMLFDLANVRVNHYDPVGQAHDARLTLSNAIVSALKEVDLARHLAVGRAVATLDNTSFFVLGQICVQDEQGVAHPLATSMGKAPEHARLERAIERLLEMGAIHARFPKMTLHQVEDLDQGMVLRYHATAFGHAVMERVLSDMILRDLTIGAAIDRKME